jgi:hypothetical protein
VSKGDKEGEKVDAVASGVERSECYIICNVALFGNNKKNERVLRERERERMGGMVTDSPGDGEDSAGRARRVFEDDCTTAWGGGGGSCERWRRGDGRYIECNID